MHDGPVRSATLPGHPSQNAGTRLRSPGTRSKPLRPYVRGLRDSLDTPLNEDTFGSTSEHRTNAIRVRRRRKKSTKNQKKREAYNSIHRWNNRRNSCEGMVTEQTNVRQTLDVSDSAGGRMRMILIILIIH